MQSRTKSFLGGAAVAVFLITAGGADAGQDHSWTQQPAQNFNAHAVALDHVIADVTITVKNGGPMTYAVQGPRYLVNDMRAQTANGVLTIAGPTDESHHSVNVWDWSKWFDYSDVNQGNVRVMLSVPRGSDISTKHMIGDITAGDTNGHLAVETISGDIRIGHVTDAKVKIVGGGDVTIASVQNSVQADVSGSGDVKIGNVGGAAAITVAGSGDTTLGNVGSAVNVSIAGSGDLNVGTVNGPVTVSLAGAGDVKIANGKADPLKVSMVGGGDFSFGGMAVNPAISAMGSGDVWLKAYTGHLSSSGMADVRVGDRDNDDDDDDGHQRHMPPAPPRPPVPPIPPAPPAPPHHN
jgi:hypothetical protein